MEVLLGIEGGGTKTDLVAAACWGGVVARTQVGGSSLSRRPWTAVLTEIERGCHQVFAALHTRPEHCLAACAGFASAGTQAAAYERMLATLLPRAQIRILTDAELALRAAVDDGDGIVVISGTGSIAWGRCQSRTARAGGTDPGNDPGSGDWIRRELARPNQRAEAVYQRAGVALAGLLLACARDLDWSAPAAFYHGGILTHLPQVRAALAAAWPHALAPLPRAPAEAALELARRELAR